MKPVLASGRVETALGTLLVAETAGGVCFLRLDAEGAEPELERWCALHALPLQDPGRAPSAALRRELVDYAAGRLRTFRIPVELHGTPFQRAVWEALCAIPFGATRTYGELAQGLARPGAARAVGRAAGANPVPLIVPCHRLLARTGVGGFSGGRGWKERLLAHEGIALAF